MSSGGLDKKRGYDATRRRERAEVERGATRSRVIAAATKLFVANGYTGTTMAAIAREAGVALQSVYSAGRSKADLLHAAVERAVGGDEEEVMVHERPAFTRIAEVADPVEQIRRFVAVVIDIHQRSAGIQRAQIEAGAVDPLVHEWLTDAHHRRLATMVIGMEMLPADRLRHSVEECVDVMWALASPEVFDLLLRVRGWDWPKIHQWLEQAAIDLLLTD